ncbi:MAG: protease modulator HflC [Thiohalospira sp.]
MGRLTSIIGVVVILGLIVVSLSLFTVEEREHALLFRLGEIVESDYEPGLHFKTPLVNNVRKFDNRVLTMDAEPQQFLTSEKKNVVVDYYVKWKIVDPVQYYRSTNGIEAQATQRLQRVINDGLLSEFAKRTIQEVVSGERSEIMRVMQERANEEAEIFGVDIEDVRVRRIDLPSEVSSSVFERMRAERARVAKDLRSRGGEAAERIRAEADRKRTIILAEAFREAERIRGRGDARAAGIFAEAYGQDEDFYNFYRSLEAYQRSFGEGNNFMVLDPSSDFFRYFDKSGGEQ